MSETLCVCGEDPIAMDGLCRDCWLGICLCADGTHDVHRLDVDALEKAVMAKGPRRPYAKRVPFSCPRCNRDPCACDLYNWKGPLLWHELAELRRLHMNATVNLRQGDDGAINARDAAAGDNLGRMLDEIEESRWRNLADPRKLSRQPKT